MGDRHSKAPSQRDEPAGGADKAQPLRVLVADSQAIYRVGIRKILALEDDIRLVAQTDTLGQTLSAVTKYPADVLLFESGISPNPAEAVSEVLKHAPSLKVVVLTPKQCEEEDTVEYFRRGVRGIVSRAIGPDLLVKCVRKVAEGETWLDSRGVNWVIDAYRAQSTQLTSNRPRARLSDKELLILSCVTQGMRNKEIAQEIGTTEQVVKNYLRKVYDKLGVSDRLELALYCLHHRLLEHTPSTSRTMNEARAASGPRDNGAAGVSPAGSLAAAAPDVTAPPAAPALHKHKLRLVE